MTDDSVERVTRHYELIAARMPAVTRAFYRRLFAASPELQPLFRIDIDVQSQHLAAALAMIVRNLRMLDLLEQPLMELGVHHARVGARPEHYPILCRAMVETMAAESGTAWSPQLQADWTDLLHRVSRIMMQGHLLEARAPRDDSANK